MRTLPSELSLLLQEKPEWVTVKTKTKNSFQAIILPPLLSGKQPDSYAIKIELEQKTIRVMEAVPGKKLPIFCPERHINPDSSLCIGYRAGSAVKTSENAKQWWESLLDHFRCQRNAARKGFWPLGKALSHGDSVKQQFQMESISMPLGLYAEVEAGIFKKSGWLGGELPRERGNSGKLVNGRSNCPRGCRYTHSPSVKLQCGVIECHAECVKEHNPILRVDCPLRSEICDLVLLETKRRKLDAKFLAEVNHRECCGTMQDCPLKK